MKRFTDPWEQVNMIGKLADLKDRQYQHTLMLGAILELLVEKGLVSSQEFTDKVSELSRIEPLNPPTHPIS